MKTKRRIIVAAIGAAVALAVTGAQAQTNRTWTGSGGDNNWFNSANWNPSDNWPQDGDVVSVTNQSVLLTNSTANLTSFTITNATLVFTNWTTAIRATDVFICSTAGLTHVACDTNANPLNTNRVYIVCSNLTLAAGAQIDVSAQGFRGGVAPLDGQGPGAGSAANDGGGGSYGGSGGGYCAPIYGSPSAPTAPGSGGGVGIYLAGNAGNGGGAVRIEATGHVQIDGLINAGGSQGASGGMAGGGSGGGIYITSLTFSGQGMLRADGGDSSYRDSGHGYAGGGGGGGRIAVQYDPAAQAAVNGANRPAVRFSSATGANFSDAGGMPGTLYCCDVSFFPSEVLTNSGQIVILSFTNWGADHWAISNCWIIAPNNLAVGISNDLIVSGAKLQMGGMYPAALSVGGDCTITNAAQLYLYAAPTGGVYADHGLTVLIVKRLTVTTNSVVYLDSNPTNGGSVFLSVGELAVNPGGQINADGRGFLYGTAPAGNGYGQGASLGAWAAGGAGYGGVGGSAVSAGGPTYGSSNAPTAPGSGGGAAEAGGDRGGRGGGLIQMEVQGTANVSGALTANGENALNGGANYRSGGGSGGAIYLRCKTFMGTGQLTASGGAGGYSTYGGQGGGGGGGRIAVWSLYRSGWSGSLSFPSSVAGGVGGVGGGNAGGTGTIVWGQIPPAGTIINIR